MGGGWAAMVERAILWRLLTATSLGRLGWLCAKEDPLLPHV